MKSIPKSIEGTELLEKASMRIYQAVYRVYVGLTLAEGEPFVKEDLSNLTVQEILDKIKDFLKSEPRDEHYIIFLHYLANYPVSMCKRSVSQTLKFLIGFHYRLGEELKKESFKEAKTVSMEELAEIFERSKATIHDCVSETETSWKEFLTSREKQKDIEAKAERELIEEAKARLRQEKEALTAPEKINV